LKEWTTSTFETLSTTNLKEEEIVDALGNDGNASLMEQVNRTNPCRKMMMMMILFKECMYLLMKTFIQVFSSVFLNISVRASALQTLWMIHP
jgi:hypothetical protein